MKFTLTYDGELQSNKAKAKWAMRQYISPQLEELWRVDTALQTVERHRYIPKDSYMNWELHHSLEDNRASPITSRRPDQVVDVCAPIVLEGWTFLPLIRDSLALRCALNINFLRKEEPGKVYQAGDMDNRLKTLFDALSVPNIDQIPNEAPPDAEPIYCLMEDDALIAGLAVETGRLLSRPNSSKAEVRLVIQVDVRVIRPKLYNQVFLGD
jgi:hypothetical protein